MLSSYLSFLLSFLCFWAVLNVACLLLPSSLTAYKSRYPEKIFAGELCWQKDMWHFFAWAECKAVLHAHWRRWPYFGRVNSILGSNTQGVSRQKTNAYSTYKLLNILMSVTFVSVLFSSSPPTSTLFLKQDYGTSANSENC